MARFERLATGRRHRHRQSSLDDLCGGIGQSGDIQAGGSGVRLV